MSRTIHENPVTNGEPVQGVCEGRIVAYWPSKDDEAVGLRAVGGGGYIPAMIVASWASPETPSPVPCANINLNVDKSNVPKELWDATRSSCRYSTEPARGCWTWIPKA